jgi:hypothetical protein
MLAFATTLALPESFATLKQTMWLREAITSAAVAGAVQAEWSRGQTDDGTALLAKYNASNRFKPGNNKPRQLGPDSNAYCDNHKCFGHSTPDCKGLRTFMPILSIPRLQMTQQSLAILQTFLRLSHSMETTQTAPLSLLPLKQLLKTVLSLILALLIIWSTRLASLSTCKLQAIEPSLLETVKSSIAIRLERLNLPMSTLREFWLLRDWTRT